MPRRAKSRTRLAIPLLCILIVPVASLIFVVFVTNTIDVFCGDTKYGYEAGNFLGARYLQRQENGRGLKG
eukprot:1227738-Rhodomonas_salina.3